MTASRHLGYEEGVRIKTAVGLTGAAVGYYFGSKAGRERYDQINRLLGRDRSKSGPLNKKARAVADLVFERARGGARGAVTSVKARREPVDPGA